MGVSDLLRELELNPPRGLSPVRSRQRNKAITLIGEESLLDAAHSFNTFQLQGIEGDGRLSVCGESLPALAQVLTQGELSALGCGVCTLGPRLEARVRELIAERRTALALALDYAGNELLYALGRRLHELILASTQSLGFSGQEWEFMGEDFGLDLPAQAAILRLAGAAEIGVNLHHSNLLLPLKSTLVIFVVGRNLLKFHRPHCKRCTLHERCTQGLAGESPCNGLNLLPVG